MSQRRERLETWAGCIANVAIVVLTVGYVSEAFDHPSVYRVSLAIVGVGLSISVCWSTYRRVTGRQRPAMTYPRKNPATVPFDDVVAAMAEGEDRIDSIRLLRENHPGLGLLDAKNLVDEVTARPDL
ncbi:hypothetical protein [Williamsia maris]|uniref:Ribosomal protein L7/L12 C-terminal domain-containing protein n=1 Tax=Williamsia maris TaxID=72806 RepID=A0ABT1HJY9_9NOCA|nr:hypothetical protein [Williamsia maris]MCP2178237.1 hypothetical protein [Williamsia maris]